MRSEVESAYFALLRAREDHADLQRYEEHLRDELRRLTRFVAETSAAADDAPGRLRRRLRHTDDPLADAVRGRQEAVRDELSRMDDRLEAAAEYARSCEAAHRRLQSAEG